MKSPPKPRLHYINDETSLHKRQPRSAFHLQRPESGNAFLSQANNATRPPRKANTVIPPAGTFRPAAAFPPPLLKTLADPLEADEVLVPVPELDPELEGEVELLEGPDL